MLSIVVDVVVVIARSFDRRVCIVCSEQKSSSSSSRDLFEGDEGFDVELLQKDLVEEGLLDQKHANGYVKEFSRDIFLFLLFPNGRKT